MILLVEDKIAGASSTINEIKERKNSISLTINFDIILILSLKGFDRAWKISEKKSLKRRMERKQRELEDDKLVLRKRQDFLRLVQQGLDAFRGGKSPSASERIDRKDDASSWGRDLGLRMWHKRLLISLQYEF